MIAAVAYRRSVYDAEREQASHVSAWIETSDDGIPLVMVRNASVSAIYNAVAHFDPDTQMDFHAIPPESLKTQLAPKLMRVGDPVPLHFRDAVGRYWKHDEKGLRCFGGPSLTMRQAKQFARDS